MKRFILSIFVAAAILSGCNEVETEGNNTPICFGEASTRAEIKNASEIKEFKVYAEVNLGSDSAPDGSDSAADGSNLQWIPLLEGERVYRDNNGDGVTDDTGNFTYDNTRYWVNDRTFYFFAVYPHETEVVVNNNEAVNGSSTYTVNFNTPATADTDLLVAGVPVDTNSGRPAPETVAFDFSHALTQMNIKVFYDTKKNPGDRFRVKKISLTGVRKQGLLTFASEVTWTPSTNEVLNFVADFGEKPKELDATLSDDEKYAWLSENYLMLIPQAIALNQVKLVIEYQFLPGKGEPTEENPWVDRKVEAYLPTTQWPGGKKITYSVSLYENNDIVFSKPVVESWGEPQSGGTIIIK